VEVADTLRDMILTGELTADAKMTQDELARLLGVSTMPVREALLRLAAEGFVDVSPSRSFTVVPTTREDIGDVFWMHATLAGELAARACRDADDALVERLRELEQGFAEARRAGDAVRMGQANWEFHRAINLAAASPKLLLVLRASLRFIPQDFYALVPEWGGTSERGHDAILEAFAKRDCAAAGRAAFAHVQEAGELLIRFFTERGYWTRPDAS
jgi:DNA-binding GntR family transcriptional regulator